jgi:hypothetical protein
MVLVLWGLMTHGNYAGSGDEPHYLAIAHSVAFDADFDLSNNYGASEPLVGAGVLEPELHARPGAGGVARPVHDIGMPVLFAPYVRLAVPLTWTVTRVVPESTLQRARLNPSLLYRHFISLAMIAVAVVLARLLFNSFGMLGATPRGALGVSALLVFSPPLLIFSILFFTELLSALLCLLVFTQIVLRDPRGTHRWWWLGCATGFLILVHARNIGLTIPLAALAVSHLRAPARRAESRAFAFGVTALIVIRTAVNYFFWGEWIANPHARLGWTGFADVFSESAIRFAGLLVDQEYGLLIYAPIYAVAVGGLVLSFKTRPGLARPVLLVAGVYITFVVCPITNVHGWTGGWSPAARFLTPLTPLLGLCLLAGLRALPKAIAIAAIALQVAISAYVWQQPKVLWNDGDGRAAICEAVGERVCARLPSLSKPTSGVGFYNSPAQERIVETDARRRF